MDRDIGGGFWGNKGETLNRFVDIILGAMIIWWEEVMLGGMAEDKEKGFMDGLGTECEADAYRDDVVEFAGDTAVEGGPSEYS